MLLLQKMTKLPIAIRMPKTSKPMIRILTTTTLKVKLNCMAVGKTLLVTILMIASTIVVTTASVTTLSVTVKV